MLGTFTLWFGWYGFNAGSALLLDSVQKDKVLALAGVNTTLAGGTAGIVALFANLWVLERYTGEPFFDVKYLMNGALSGLVAITGGCGVVEPWAADAAAVLVRGTWSSKGLLGRSFAEPCLLRHPLRGARVFHGSAPGTLRWL